MMLKRLLALSLTTVVTAVLLLGIIPKQKAGAVLFTPNCTVQSESAILMNMEVGEIVYEKNADMKQMPAALAQIMTAVLVLEQCDDITTETITAEEEMYSAFQSEPYLEDLRYAKIEAGDTLTVEDLLYAMMLTSSCEAAYMLCEHFSDGNASKFVEKMNQKAEQLEMVNTRFTDGHCLYSARQLTTARDMMKLLSYAMTLPRFESIACAANYTPATAAAQGREDVWKWEHSNLMIESDSEYYCNGVRGIKTGTTQDGGRCIAVKASRDGNNYLLICMNAPLEDAEGNKRFYHLEDAKNILDWAYMHLSFTEVLSTTKPLGQITVTNATDEADYVIVYPKEGYSCIWCDTLDISSVQKITDWEKDVPAPVSIGDKMGTVTLVHAGETLAVIDVVASNNVERSFWKYNLSEIPGFFRSTYFRGTFIWAIVFCLAYIGLCVFFAFRYHEDRKRRAAARAGHASKK